MRLPINKSLLARQYNHESSERLSAYDTPFADMGLPIYRKSMSSNIPVLKPPYTKRDTPLREGQSDNTVLDGVDGIELCPRDIDANEKWSMPAPQHDIGQNADKTSAESCEPVVYSAELDTSNDGNNAVASATTRKPASFETQPLPSGGEEPSVPIMATEDRNGETSKTPNALSDSERLQKLNELSTFQHSESALHTDPALEIPISRTIHILGDNAVGKFFAHALAGAPKAPPITLLMHRPWLIKKWYNEGGAIKLLRGNRIEEQSGFNVELTEDLNAEYSEWASQMLKQNPLYGQRDTIIDNLVVTTEGYTTISVLAAIRHRLRSSSTICFTQDSVGIIDYVNSSVFPDVTERPSYILGSISHEVRSTSDEYSIIEHEVGRLALTTIPRAVQEPQTKDGEVTIRRMDLCWQPTSKYLMRTFHRAPDLCATSLNTRAFYRDQLENLAITSVLGPLSVVYECRNSQLLANREVSRTIKLLLKEISAILRSLPEVSHIPSVNDIFSAKRLESLVFSAIEKSGKNRTSMLLDVMQRRKTKIDFYNGYLLRRAEESGIDCPRLEMITSMVKGKQSMRRSENNSHIPFKYQH